MADLYCLDNARHPAQADEMRRLDRGGVCVFCPDGLANATGVLHRTRHWLVLANKYPYAGSMIHLLIVPFAHVSTPFALTPEQRSDYWNAEGQAVRIYRLSDYATFTRQGDPSRTGGTIAHLHTHLVAAMPNEVVRLRVGGR